jgi:hypothetical protein
MSDPSVQALSREDTQLDLGDIEPASVFGSIYKLKPIPEGFRYLGREGFIERSGRMRVQVVHHQRDFFCLGIVISNDLEKSSPILPGSSLSNLYYSFPGKGFTGKEDVAGTTPTVFIVVSGRLSWQTGDGRSRLANKLSW